MYADLQSTYSTARHSGKELGGSHNSVPNTPSGGSRTYIQGDRTFTKSTVNSAPITRTSSWPWITEGDGSTGHAGSIGYAGSTVEAGWRGEHRVGGGGGGECDDVDNTLSLLKIELEGVGRREGAIREVVTATSEDFDITDSDKNSEKGRDFGGEEEGGDDYADGETEDAELSSPSVVSTKSEGRNGQSVQQLLNPKGAKKNNSKQKKKTQKK